MKKWLTIAAIVLGAGILAAVFLYFLGITVRVEPRLGRATDAVIEIGDAEKPSWLVQDFPEGATARNLVILIGDGMGFAQVVGARAALVGLNGRLNLERLPVTGWHTTHSVDRLLTDSAAGATALATGFKTLILSLGVDGDGQSRTTLAEAAAARGKAVGLVTDSYIWDATPAAFATHVVTRTDFAAIAEQMAASGFQLLLGEEAQGLEEDDPEGAFMEYFRHHRVVREPDELPAAIAGEIPVLGLFPAGSIGDFEQEPRLDDLAVLALERLASDDDGFVLLVETEETDTASHRNNFDRMSRGVAALDRAVAAAMEFARRDGETLVVVTADHDTGGLALKSGKEGDPLRVHWATVGHTGNPVPIFAYGPGAERLGGVHDNVEVAWILAELMGLELRQEEP